MFAPQCISGQPEPPSKETCQSALDDCEPVIISLGLEFPDDFDCDALPGNSETEEEGTADDRVLGEFTCFPCHTLGDQSKLNTVVISLNNSKPLTASHGVLPARTPQDAV